MSPAERTDQAQARKAMFEFFDTMWDGLKRRALRPADHPEKYHAVAAMRDLTSEMYFGNLLLGAALGEDEDDRLGEHAGAWCAVLCQAVMVTAAL